MACNLDVYGRMAGGFAYRIEMNWMIFVIAGVTALVLEMVTIGGSVVEGGAVEPVESLRNE